MNEPLWIADREAVAMNARAVSLFGGLEAGVRDQNLLRVALARPLHKWHYEDLRPDIFDLAAAYAFALCKGHVFHDGNKRTAHAVAATFLEINGWSQAESQPDIVTTMISVAEGILSEHALAAWFRKTSVRA
ncbi:MAG: type II toxin-antitoxin system death-on-curing family toxin [Alphaproteobacteria bacterium]|nr:type II toxin-antitoxin system death-on-curing family toxin [Alphaproteobacteria bacterium]